MKFSRYLSVIDSHTEGMPTRVVTGGVAPVPGSTMMERLQYFNANLDDLRRFVTNEPRGHEAMFGAILQPATRSDADVGVLFLGAAACRPMCGHGSIGVATVMVETGMVNATSPITTVCLDTPAGLVRAAVDVADGRAMSVTITNVPSFVVGLDQLVEVDGIGVVRYDMAFGGNFYAILPLASLHLTFGAEQNRQILEAGMKVMAAINEQARPVHPVHPDIAGCSHVQLTAPGTNGSNARNAMVIYPGWFDRSPCGTGTSARLAQLYARGELKLNEPFVNASIIGTRFTGEVVDETSVAGCSAVVTTIKGRAWITGMGQLLLDPGDPFPAGFQI